MRSKVSGDPTPLYDPVAGLEDREQVLAFVCYCLGIDPTAPYTIDDIVNTASEVYTRRPNEGDPTNLGIEAYEPSYLFQQKYRVSLLRTARRMWRWKTLDEAKVLNG